MRLGLIVALADEASALGLRPWQAQEVLTLGARGPRCIVTGMGPEAARRGAERLLAAGVTDLCSIGTAGALVPELHPGQLVVPQAVLWQDACLPCNASLRARVLAHWSGAPLHEGRVLGQDTPLASPAAKAAAGRERGAVIVDMESGAVAALAHSRGVPFLVLRVVVDTVDTALPPIAVNTVDAYGRPHLPALLGALLRQPQELGALMRLGRAMQAAKRTLGDLAPLLEDSQV